MNIRYFVFMISLLSFNISQAQEITVEQQNIAFNYIEKSQMLILDFNQIALANNQLTLRGPHENLGKERQALLDQITSKVSNFEKEEKPEQDFNLREITLNYASFLKKILTKDINQYYTKKANKDLKCNNCLNAIKKAYEMQLEDYKIADGFYDKMITSLAKVAEKHLIEFDQDNSQNERVDKMREAIDYTMTLNIGMKLAVETYNEMAKNFQEILEKKSSTETFNLVEKKYKQKLLEVQKYMDTLDDNEKAFYGDQSLWDAANLFLLNLSKIDKNGLKKMRALLTDIENQTSPDKERINELVSLFGATGNLAKNYEQKRVAFLNKQFQ